MMVYIGTGILGYRILFMANAREQDAPGVSFGHKSGFEIPELIYFLFSSRKKLYDGLT